MDVVLIPARMGSQRLSRKNLREIKGVPLITRAIRKCKLAGCFDEIWVNSEHTKFKDIAETENVNFHLRPAKLADNKSTSEEYIYEFIQNHKCDYIFQVHSIAPLLTVESIVSFVDEMHKRNCDCLLSVEEIQIECAYKDLPVNFTFDKKTNSQELSPIQRISWAITGWRADSFRKAYDEGHCATYSGDVGFHTINALASHVIKTEEDLKIAELLFPLVDGS